MPDAIIDGRGSGNVVGVTSENRMMVDIRSFNLEVAKGNIPGHSEINKFGRNSDIDQNVKETLWDVGGKYPFLSGAEFLYLRSSSTADDSGGVGALSIAISGLDTNYVEQAETIILNGLGSVRTTNEYLRLNRMYTVQTGGSEFNIGSILATGSVNVTSQAMISAGEGQTLMAVYNIPSGLNGYVTNFNCSFDKGGAGATPALLDIDFVMRMSGNGFRVTNHQGLISTGTTHFQHEFNPPLKFIEKTDIKVDAISTVNDTDVHGGFDLILIDE